MFAVIVNPVSGGGEAVRLAIRISERIAAMGQESRLFETSGDGDAARQTRAAVEAGELAPERWESYRTLKQETAAVRERREQARWMQGEKASGSARACKARRARQAVAAKRRPKER